MTKAPLNPAMRLMLRMMIEFGPVAWKDLDHAQRNRMRALQDRRLVDYEVDGSIYTVNEAGRRESR